MSDTRIVLACASDAGYAPYAAVMLASAIAHTPDADFLACFLHPADFPERTRLLVRQALKPYGRRVELRFIAVADQRLEGLPLFENVKSGAIPPVTWYRVLLPELLPGENRALYVDSDTLVLDSLLPLWNTDLQGKPLAAVCNPFWNNDKDRDWLATMGLEDGRAYFNSGVLLMDLECWRRQAISASVIEYGHTHVGWIRFPDQDALVAVLHDQWVSLAPRWNGMRAVLFPGKHTATELFTQEELKDALSRPGIVHFTGSANKPWIDPREHPYGRIHQRFARKLPWPVVSARLSLRDVDHFLTRHNHLRLRQWFRHNHLRLRQWFRHTQKRWLGRSTGDV